MMTPTSLLDQGFVRAQIEIVEPKVPDPIIPLCFNPTEYQLQKTNTFAEIPIPGLESPPIQFIRGAAEKLTADFIVDTSDTLDDVREKYVNKLRDLLRIKKELHAPPIVKFGWAKQEFKGVLESLNITFTLFTPEGVPIRAKLGVTIREYRPVEIQVKESPKASPDFEKAYTVRRGDTLASIAAAIYRDPALWRPIAEANDIQDPRRIAPGRNLLIPRLR
jgi:LysM repeat protein